MPILTQKGLSDPGWVSAGIATPTFDLSAMRDATARQPRWIHFGAGNLFRGYVASLAQRLLEQGDTDTGVIAAELFDLELMPKIYAPHDKLCLLVSLYPDGGTKKQIIASVAEAVSGRDRARLTEIFTHPALQMVSFTITEKGYSLRGGDGSYFAAVSADMQNGPEGAVHPMGVIAALLWARFTKNAAPAALCSLDNCSQNGDKLGAAVREIAAAWQTNGFVTSEFLSYLKNKITFPWSMIDKITPRPAKVIEENLAALGIEGMSPVVTDKGTFIAPFVNAEAPQYLVIEDDFPNGRPPLERAGVYFTDRATVEKTERMKVTTCLNPLHTALAVYGCLLGHASIAAAVADPELLALVERIGFKEGLPVVTDPGILNPRSFLDEVLRQRLPNPFIPDTPQRIATDTSQKIPVRFGETLKLYAADPALSVGTLVGIPLAIAGWLRYLLGVDDAGNPMPLSPDPLLPELQAALAGVTFGHPDSLSALPLLSRADLFGVDLMAAGLAERVLSLLRAMLDGPGTVRRTLQEALR